MSIQLVSPAALFDLTDRVALITGGGGNLGIQFASVLAGAGARVVLADVPAGLERAEARDFMAGSPDRIIGLAGDVGRESDVRELVAQVERRFGRLDILINNAATKTPNIFAPNEEFPLEDWNEVMRVNLDAMFLCVRESVGLMRRQGRGSIINISSIYGIVGPDQRIYEGSKINAPAVYSAAKAGVIGLTKYLATYYAHERIRCNAVTPGGVFAGHTDPFLSNYSRRVPLGRMAEAHEIGPAVLYLASDASSYVTGQNLVVDGGLTAW